MNEFTAQTLIVSISRVLIHTAWAACIMFTINMMNGKHVSEMQEQADAINDSIEHIQLQIATRLNEKKPME